MSGGIFSLQDSGLKPVLLIICHARRNLSWTLIDNWIMSSSLEMSKMDGVLASEGRCNPSRGEGELFTRHIVGDAVMIYYIYDEMVARFSCT